MADLSQIDGLGLFQLLGCQRNVDPSAPALLVGLP
jgi:hypothetical protein